MKFSVLMSIYEKEQPEFLVECLESLNNQTMKATETVLVEDGPLPQALLDIIEKYRKSLLIVSIKLEKNVGLAVALNEGLKACSYNLVARMDTDDISLPSRFKKQISFMHLNPNITASSAALEEFDEYGFVFSTRNLPEKHADLVVFAKTRSPISHAAAVFSKNAVLQVGGYPLFKRSQDVALWSLLIMKGYKIANLPDKLFLVRAGADFMARNGLKNFKSEFLVSKFQYEIGFLTKFEFLRNILIRLTIAILPTLLKKVLYSYAKK